MAGLFQLLFLGLALGVAWLIWVTARSLARPPRRGYTWAVARGRPSDPSELPKPRAFETISIEYPGGQIGPAWMIEGDDPAGPVVIFSHGWGESKMDVLPRLDALAPVSSRIVSWDMPGHGEAPPGVTPLGTSEWRILARLVEIIQGGASAPDEPYDAPPPPGAPPVVLYGYSLGAGVAIEVAGDRPKRIAAVIAESPYRLVDTPARNMLHIKRLPWRFNLRPAMFLLGLARDRGPRWTGFDRAQLVKDIECPLLVIHGDRDEISPLEDGTEIARNAGVGREGTTYPSTGRLVTLPGATHFDLWLDPARADARTIATEAIQDAIRSVAGRPTYT